MTETEILEKIEAMNLSEVRTKRNYLGASQIGGECTREMWYGFRHCGCTSPFPARILRLFDRGNREEEVFVKSLRSIGIEVWDIDTRTGKQWEISDYEGHFQGHADGVGKLPDGSAVLLEFKTYNDKRFQELVKQKIRNTNKKYYAQMQVYMHHLKLTRALFCAVNKNDDDLYFEFVPYSEMEFIRINNRIYDILNTDTPPVRVSEDPNSYVCRYCSWSSICHDGKPISKSCRNCRHGSLGPAATWVCEVGNEFGTLCDQYIDTTAPIIV